MNNGIFENIRRIEGYQPGEFVNSSYTIKLNTNENSFPPSPKVKETINLFNIDTLARYPNSDSYDLKRELSKYYALKEQNVFVGNGSDEVLALCFLAFFNSNKPVLFPDITYNFYKVWCRLFNIKYSEIPLNNNFEISPDGYICNNGGIVIANPNSPTGIYMNIDAIKSLLEKNLHSIVIVDEAYIDFGGESVVQFVNQFENLIIVQTFSKYRSMAGVRIGYALGNPRLIKVLDTVKNSFNSYPVDSISQSIGIAALSDDVYYRECANIISGLRDEFINKLDDLGFSTLPSKTNFIFTKHNTIKADYVYQYLKENQIYVRYFDQHRIDEFLRITIGTENEMNILYSKLLDLCNKS